MRRGPPSVAAVCLSVNFKSNLPTRPKANGGTDEYSNLILVTEQAHKLIHATVDETTAKYLKLCSPEMEKLNELRKLIGNKPLMGKIED